MNDPADHQGFRVALVSMPFASTRMPSLQLGLLHSVLRQAGFAVDSHHLNLNLAAVLSPAVYEEIGNQWRRMTGDWLFSISAFGDAAPGEERYLGAVSDGEWLKGIGKDESFLVELRREVLPGFIESCSREVPVLRHRDRLEPAARDSRRDRGGL